ncbi:MAG: 50S ribosomal protein L31e [Euryarchaeota archaeon]|jgi:large subunit ribosomal protein L31e|nr:50S ribosomal protein L31e [Euryarchaeota archaeon]
MAEKVTEKELERIYIIPLRRAKIGPTSRAVPRAVDDIRHFLMKHMKVEQKNVWIDGALNKQLWMYGKFWVPSKIRVRAVKFEDGVVEATLPEMGEKKSRREFLKEEKEKKTPILRRDEEKVEEGVAGAEGYDITPTGDGEVKIKKKKEKAPKEEELGKKKEKPKKPEGKAPKSDADKKKTKVAKKPKTTKKKSKATSEEETEKTVSKRSSTSKKSE